MIDAREGVQLEKLPALLKHLRKDHPISLVFIEASEDALLRRYSETRRPHPLGKDIFRARKSAPRARTDGAHSQARGRGDRYARNSTCTSCGTSSRERFKNPDKRPLMVSVVSFGYRYGVPTRCRPGF